MALTARKWNRDAYVKLLAEVVPQVIATEQENDRMIAALEKLAFAKRKLSPEEEQLSRLLSLLIEDFEQRRYPVKPVSPVAMLEHLMEENDLKQKDLLDVFGTESAISQVLSGKREFSKEHIRGLANRFHVSPELFFNASGERPKRAR